MKKILLYVALCTGLVGCVDYDYDLYELDTTVQVGNEQSVNVFPIEFKRDVQLKETIKKSGSITHITGPDNREFFALAVANGAEQSGRQQIRLRLPASGAKVTKEQVGQIDPVSLGTMPEFLDHPDVCFDVDNPALLLDVDNHLPCEIKTKATLTALDAFRQPIYDKGEKVHMEIDLDVPAGTDQKLYLADRMLEWMPEFMQGYEYHADHDIAHMVRRIPHYILVEIGDVDVVDPDTHMDPTKLYDVVVNFGVYIPIKYQKDFHLIYDWEQDDLLDAIENLDQISVQNISLSGEAESNLPLDLELEFAALNALGEEIPALSSAKSRALFTPQDARHTFSLTLESTDPEMSIINFVNGINPRTLAYDPRLHLTAIGLRAHVRAGSNPSQYLYTDTYIRLYNTKVSVAGPIIILEDY